MLKKSLRLFSLECWVLASILLFIIVTPSINFFIFDQQRIFQIEIIFFSLLLSLSSNYFRKQIIQQFFCFSPVIRFLLFLLLLLAVSSALSAPLVHYAILESSMYCGLFFLSLVIARLVYQNNSLFQAVFFTGLIVSSFFYQITFFSGYLASFIENIPLQWPEPFSGFSNVRLFNQYQLWLCFLISLPLLIYPNLDPRLKNAIETNAVGWAILLFVSGSRGAIGAVFLTLAFAFLFFKQQAMLIIKLNLKILCLGFLGFLLLFKLLPVLLDSDILLGWRSLDEMTTDASRLYLWKTALNYIIAHPCLGIGAMHYAYYPNPVAAHPHNSLLQWGAEMGLPSLIILITLVGRGFIRWIKGFSALDKNTAEHFAKQQLWIALFCTMTTASIYSMVDGVIVMPVSQILMTATAGWMFGLYFQSEPVIIVNATKNSLSMILITAILMTLTYTAMPDVAPRLAGLEDQPTRPHPEPLQPRFWQQGQIPN